MTMPQVVAYSFYWLLGAFFAWQAYWSDGTIIWVMWIVWGIFAALVARNALNPDSPLGEQKKGDQQ